MIKGVATDMYIRVRGTATVTDTSLANYRNRARLTIFSQDPIVVLDGVRRFSGSGEASGTTKSTVTPTVTPTPTPTVPREELASTGMNDSVRFYSLLGLALIGAGAALAVRRSPKPVRRHR